MPLRLYNTLHRKEEDFQPLKAGEVTMYTCGPTVYGRPHVGNYSSFLMADLLKRWLQAGHGYTVKQVKNITDVGHLVRDADDGEDKIEKQAREEHGAVTHDTVLAIARKYEEQYLADEKLLYIEEPFARPRATETIPEMIAMIASLLLSKNAYETADSVYFDVTSFPQYGALSGNTLDKLDAGARVDVNEQKRHPADFALWKKCVGPNASHALRWDSPWGPGFPGWHIECSAMSRKFLGDTIDLHTGGEDNIFPHHECEIAQSECVTGAPFVRVFLHKRRIDMGAAKMSKSLGNVLTLTDMQEKGYDPLDLRYYLLSVHYRTNLKFSWKGMDDAKKARGKIIDWMKEVAGDELRVAGSPDQTKAIEAFRKAMDADLNTPAALAVVFDCMNQYYAKGPFDCRSFIDLVRSTFGCFASVTEAVPAPVQKLVDERAQARTNKDFAASDRLRAEIAALGYEVRDTDGGQKVRKM